VRKGSKVYLCVMFFGDLGDNLPHGPKVELKRHLGQV
jgi:hypothetical protein